MNSSFHVFFVCQRCHSLTLQPEKKKKSQGNDSVNDRRKKHYIWVTAGSTVALRPTWSLTLKSRWHKLLLTVYNKRDWLNALLALKKAASRKWAAVARGLRQCDAGPSEDEEVGWDDIKWCAVSSWTPPRLCCCLSGSVWSVFALGSLHILYLLA